MGSHKAENKWSFRMVWCFLSNQIGECRLPINHEAINLHDFLIPQDDNLGFMKELIRDVYKKNKCADLNSKINIELTFDVLGKKAAQLKQTKKDDLADIELLEEIGWHLQQYYPLPKQSKNSEGQTTAKIISLNSVKNKTQNFSGS